MYSYNITIYTPLKLTQGQGLSLPSCDWAKWSIAYAQGVSHGKKGVKSHTPPKRSGNPMKKKASKRLCDFDGFEQVPKKNSPN